MNKDKQHSVSRGRTRALAYAILFLVAILAVFPEFVREAYEIASVQFSSDAERAFAYGERHFAADEPDAYNIILAEYFFRRAQALDPTLRYVEHELARIDFLKGNFAMALSEIDIQILNQGEKTPNSYYIRALIEGFMGQYDTSARDYEHYLRFDPRNWAAMNDYAWVLLKAGRPQDAARITSDGLKYFPDNAWLLNSNAIALFELGNITSAKEQVTKAAVAVDKLSEKDWLLAYPGNDPKVAAEGLAAFKEATAKNVHIISIATSTSKL